MVSWLFFYVEERNHSHAFFAAFLTCATVHLGLQGNSIPRDSQTSSIASQTNCEYEMPYSCAKPLTIGIHANGIENVVPMRCGPKAIEGSISLRGVDAITISYLLVCEVRLTSCLETPRWIGTVNSLS